MNKIKPARVVPLTSDKVKLIRWVIAWSRIDMQALGEVYDDIELFCAQHPVGIATLLDSVINYSNMDYDLKHSIMYAKREWE